MKTTRRVFLASSVVAGLAGAARAQGANERLGVALIGCGGRGNAHLIECLKKREALNVEVVALCDVWQVNLKSTEERVRQSGAPAPKTFTRYEEVLALPEVNCVIIATPDFAHTPILLDVVKAGKHVYVEKPMSINLEEANAAVDAVESSKIVCQVGTQRRSEGPYIAGAQAFQSGLLGTLIKVHTTYNDHKARWIRDYSDVKESEVDWEQYLMHFPEESFDPRRFRLWHLYKDFTTGLIGLLGVHCIDIAHYYTEDPLPETAVGLGRKIAWTEREHDDTQLCVFKYPKGHMLQFESRLGNDNGGPPHVFYGTRGTFDTDSWTFSGAGGGDDKIQEPVIVTPVESPTHLENWIQCIREGNKKTNADIHAGYAHSVASIMGYLACETGQRITYHPDTRTFSQG